jgi:nucleoside-diphosphate-sugar epimerase
MDSEFSGKRALITGGSGFIGFHLGKRLESLGSHVILVDKKYPNENDLEFQDFIQKESVDFLLADLTNELEVNKLPISEYVFHFAALNGTQNFYEKPFDVLVNSGMPIVHLLNHFGCKTKFIYAGSSESYAPGIKLGITSIPTPEEAPFIIDDPTNPRWSYSMGKSFGEIAIQAYGTQKNFNSMVIRFHNVYGPRMGINHVVPDLILNAINNKFILKGWENTRSFIYIDDAITDIIKLVTENEFSETSVFNLGGDDEVSILSLASLLLKVMKIDAEFDLEEAPIGSVMRRRPDLALINSTLGDRERVSLSAGLEKTVNWYIQNRWVLRS